MILRVCGCVTIFPNKWYQSIGCVDCEKIDKEVEVEVLKSNFSIWQSSLKDVLVRSNESKKDGRQDRSCKHEFLDRGTREEDEVSL